jgi:hypothetical protein
VVQVFVTSERFDGDLGGLAGADTICTNAALAADPPLSGTWTAWLSTSAVNAEGRITDTDGFYQLLDGTNIAGRKTDLLDGRLDAPINLDENTDGVVFGPESGVWTATANNGIYAPGSCQDWSTNVGTQDARVGDATIIDGGWTNLGDTGDTCNLLNRLYCFSDAISN